MEVRKNLGYMTQAFSLYGELTVRQNLVLHARLYHLPPDKAKARIEELVERFGLGAHLDALAEDLPMGLRQRLSLAVAVLHEPQILILDEPTSGVDPVARDSFWELLIDLSRKQGVTIFVTTHFMNEGMRCDRISLMNAGKVLACDAPQKLIDGARRRQPGGGLHRLHGGRDRRRRAARRDARTRPPPPSPPPAAAAPPPAPAKPSGLAAAPRPDARLRAQRDHADPPRPGPPGLRLRRLGAADAGLRLRHHHRRRAHPLRRRSISTSRPRAARISSSSPARRATSRGTPPARSADEALKRLQSDDVSVVLEIPPSFGRDFRRGSGPGGRWRRWTAR